MGCFGTMLRFACAMSVICIASTETVTGFNLPLPQYRQFITGYSNRDYFPIQSCGYTWRGRVVFGPVVKKRNGEGWSIRYNVDTGGLRSAFDLLVLENKYRIASLSGFEENGQHRFTAIFHSQKNPVTVKVRWAQTRLEWSRNLTGFLAHNYVPVYQNGYTVNGVPYFNTVYEKRNVAMTWRIGISPEEFNRYNPIFQRDGYRLLSLSGYSRKAGNGEIGRITALWERTHGPSQKALVDVRIPKKEPGYMVTLFSGYEIKYLNGPETLYAIVWTKNN